MDVHAGRTYDAALAVRAFQDHECPPGPASQLDVEARSPAVTHTVSVGKVRDWLESSAKSLRDRLLKEWLKGLLAS
jgi:hypothetical protein